MAVNVSKIPNNNKFDPVREAILDLQGQLDDTGGSIGNGTLTVSTSGTLTGSGTFTANQSDNTTITIGIDDSTYLTSADISDFITLTDLSVTTSATPSGGGALSYDDTTGVFTFTPADAGTGLTLQQVTANGNTTTYGISTGNISVQPAGTGNGVVAISANSVGNASVTLTPGSTAGDGVISTTIERAISFRPFNTEKVVIASDGNMNVYEKLAVGKTTAASTYHLEVDGTALANNFITSMTASGTTYTGTVSQYYNALQIRTATGGTISLGGSGPLSVQNNVAIKDGDLDVNGDVTADFFIGDGSLLTNIAGTAQDLQDVTDNGAITTNAIEVGGNIQSLSQIRAGGWYNVETGSSGDLAFEIGTSGGNAYALSYDRNTSSYGDMNFAAVNFNFDERGGTTTIEGNEVWHAGNDDVFTLDYVTDHGATTSNAITVGGGTKVTDSSTSLTRFYVENTGNAEFGSGIFMEVKNAGTRVGSTTMRIDRTGKFQLFNGGASEVLNFQIDENGDATFTKTISATDLKIESGSSNSIRIGDAFGSGGTATIHNYQKDLYLQYGNGLTDTNLRLGGGNTKCDLRLDDGGGDIHLTGQLLFNRDGKSGNAIAIEHVENSTWPFIFYSSSVGNDNPSGFWVNGDGTPDMRLRSTGSTITALIHSNGTSYINGGNLAIGATSSSSKLTVSSGTPTGAQAVNADTVIAIDSSADQYLEFRTTATNTGLMQGMLFTDNGLNAFIGYKEYTGGTAGTYGEAIHIAHRDFSASDVNNGIYFGTNTNPQNGVNNVNMFIKGNGNIGVGAIDPDKQLTFAQKADDAIQIRRYTTTQGNPAEGTGISWTWSSLTTDDETWAAIRAIMPGSGNTHLTFSTTSGGGETNLSPKMWITDVGNVGIGKEPDATYSGYPLQLYGGNQTYIHFSNATHSGNVLNGLVIGNDSGTAYIQQRENQPLHLSTNDTPRIAINGDGRVGIGTTSPTNTKVHIVGNASYVGNYGYNTLTLEDASGYPGLNWRQGNNNWLFRKNGQTQELELLYSSNASAPTTGTYTRWLRIEATGMVETINYLKARGVRIGRDFSIATRATVRLDSASTSAPSDILFGHTAAADESSWTGVYWSLSSRANSDGNKFHFYRGGGNPVGGSESILMTLDPNLRVGINNTTPSSTLDVSGTFRVTGYSYLNDRTSIGGGSPWTTLLLNRPLGDGGVNSGVALAFEGGDYAEMGYRLKANGANYYQVLYNGSAINWKHYTGSAYDTRMSLSNGGTLTLDGGINAGSESNLGDINFEVGSYHGIRFRDGSVNKFKWGHGKPGNEFYLYDYTKNGSIFTAKGNGDIYFTPTGDFGIKNTSPSYALDVTGTIRASSDIIAFSDARVKENVKTIDNALDKVTQLRGVSYNKIGETEEKIGVIAQEIEKVLPQVVQEDDEGMKSVAYGNIVGVLIEAIKEQQKQIDELKARLDA